MLSRLWGWIAAGFSLMLAALLFVAGQRDKAKTKTKTAKRQARAERSARDVEKKANAAQAAAREESSEVQRNDDDRPSDKRPSGDFRR